MSAVVNKSKSTNHVRTIIKSATDPIRSTSDITSNNSSTVSLNSISSSNSLLDPNVSPIPSRSSDPKKKTPKTPRKYSAPVQPKSGALAAAMMAATVAGGSGFLDARKGIHEESRGGLLRSKKSKATLYTVDDSDVPSVPLPNSNLSSSASSMVNVPSRLVDSTTLTDVAAAEAITEIPEVPKIKDRKYNVSSYILEKY